MKGYNVSIGYMGYVPSEGGYQLFESEDGYKEYIIEMREES